MAEESPSLRALLVGIDRYPAPAEPGGFGYPSLYGAVGDALRVDRYLRETLRVPEERITQLLAPHGGGRPERLPTQAHVAAALLELESRCRSGEQALVYYSGHGGRAPTLLPEVKGARGLDEVLAPVDVADPGVPYLRDVELAAWLRRLAARAVFVTLVLDCCHSGGAVRRGRRVRGHERVDPTPRPADRLLATREEVAGAGREASPGTKGFVLLAACRPHERALEVDGEDGCGGVLTDALLTVLRRTDDPGLTYRRLHAALTVRLHAAGYLGQTPVVEGEPDRLLFGREKLPGRRGVEVLEVEGWPGERLRLSTGGVHGTRRGERFAIVSAATGRDGSAERIAEVEVTEVGGTDSWAAPAPRGHGARRAGAGDAAILVDPGPRALRRTVGWTDRSRPAGGEDRSAWLAALVAARGDAFLAVARPGEPCDFEVLEEGGLLEIRDAGGSPIPNLGPPLALRAPGTPSEIVGRLAHLARYWNVRALECLHDTSALSGALRLRVERVDDVEPPTEPLRVRDGTLLRLTLENAGTEALNVAILDLQPDLGIRQIYPARDSAPWATVECGRPVALDLAARLPRGVSEGVDVLKAIGATRPFDLASVELPPVGAALEPIRSARRGDTAAFEGSFGRLLAALGSGGRKLRAAPDGGSSPGGWTTSAVEVRVVGDEMPLSEHERENLSIELEVNDVLR